MWRSSFKRFLPNRSFRSKLYLALTSLPANENSKYGSTNSFIWPPSKALFICSEAAESTKIIYTEWKNLYSVLQTLQPLFIVYLNFQFLAVFSLVLPWIPGVFSLTKGVKNLSQPKYLGSGVSGVASRLAQRRSQGFFLRNWRKALGTKLELSDILKRIDQWLNWHQVASLVLTKRTVEASNVINDPKCNKGPKCNSFSSYYA